jgi:hypothetical protein
MAGERLPETNLTPLGLAGDRIVHVENARGRAQDQRVLRSIVDRFDGRLALNAAVVRGALSTRATASTWSMRPSAHV